MRFCRGQCDSQFFESRVERGDTIRREGLSAEPRFIIRFRPFQRNLDNRGGDVPFAQ